MDEQNPNKNLLLATGLSFVVILVWFVLFPPPEAPPEAETAPIAQTTEGGAAPEPEGNVATGDTSGPSPNEEQAAVDTATRITIDTPKLSGTLSLADGRIDMLSLKNYRETLAPDSPIVQLFRPAGSEGAYFSLAGWGLSRQTPSDLIAGDLPGPGTEWQLAAGDTLTPETPVTLEWQNSKGLHFTRHIAVDSDFMFTLTDRVENKGPGTFSLYPYASISRQGLPAGLKNFFILHEGLIGRGDGELAETDYDDLRTTEPVPEEGGPALLRQNLSEGWIGFTDHFWMSALIPAQGTAFTTVAKYLPSEDIYRTAIRYPEVTLAPGSAHEVQTRLFAGAKEWAVIRAYENDAAAPIPGFLDSIDWGWFFFLTKPIFAVLHWLHHLIGNMGLAIIALTFVLKLIVLPLAYKSYVSMARMKELQPEIEALKARTGEDRTRFQREMMQLYKEKKVNPAAGCLPILVQIPIFFSLYKVIFVTIELRHAPFFGWINDLSAPDSSSLYNLFGLLPWAAPEMGSFLHLIFLGILPLLLGITMWLQQKLNPTPADPAQAAVFAWMPWIFMFMLGGFASGLVIYWITNNIITFSQQYLIMRSHGHRPDVFGNIRASFRRRAKAEAGAKK